MIEIITQRGERRPATAQAHPKRHTRRASPAKRRSYSSAAIPVGSVLLVRVLVDKNPKKLGAADRFAKYENGMPVTRYAELVGDSAQAYRDLVWDRDMGYIELVPADEVDACGADEEVHVDDVARDDQGNGPSTRNPDES